MYPERELIRLAAHKAALRGRICARRVECADAFAGLLRPLAWVDRALALGRKLGPFARLAAIPLTLLLKRVLFPRAKILGTLLRWGPSLFVALRSFNSR